MKHLKVSTKLLSGFFGLMIGLGSANSAVVYDWTGTCATGCTGTATAVLTLTNTYVPGLTVDSSFFVSFAFSSSAASFSTNTVSTLSGFLPANSGIGVIFFVSGSNVFSTSGAWTAFIPPNSLNGIENQWTLRTSVSAVPLPASAWMFISSLLAFGLYGWWRRRRMAAEAQPA
jgi:hypothetical protein